MNTQNIHPFLKKLLNGATVEWKPLGEVAKLIRGKGLSKKDIGTGQVPIILYGELYTTYGDKIFSNDIVSFCDKSRITNQPQIQQNDILLPVSSTTKDANIGTISVYLDNKIVFLGGDAVIFRPDKSINSVFLMYCLNSNLMQKDKMRCVKGTTINHLDPQKFATLQIPIPPLAVQSELVKILDKFTELTDELSVELTKELTARKKQYAYYRDKLLTFADDAVEWKPLGEVAELKRGKTITAKSKTDGDIPVISGGQQPAYYNADFNRKGETITIAGSGAYAGFVMYWNEPIFVSDAFSVKPNLVILNTKYIFYYLLNKQNYIHNLKRGSGVPHVYPKDLATLQIPIPPLAEQERIVNILDKFDTLTNSISEGIPREIELRKKQYEYYRDKLLTFPKATKQEKVYGA